MTLYPPCLRIPRILALSGVLALSAFSTACDTTPTPSPAAGDADAGSAVDANQSGTDAALRSDASAPSSPGDIVGTWERRNDVGELMERFVFDSDGGFAFDELSGDPDDDHVEGTYTANATHVVASATDAVSGDLLHFEFSYFANATNLAIGAFYPVGQHDGVIGAWEATLLVQEVNQDGDVLASLGGEQELTLAADGSGTLVSEPAEGPGETQPGSWEQLADDTYVFRYSVGNNGTVGMHFELIDGAAIGSPNWKRADAADGE